MDLELPAREKRLAVVGLALSGVVHLLAPGVLLRIARRSYGFWLDVAFEPRSNAARRVRLVGLASLLAAVLARRLA